MYIDRSAFLQQEVQLLLQLNEQIQRYAKLISRETLELLAIDAKKQVTESISSYNDTVSTKAQLFAQSMLAAGATILAPMLRHNGSCASWTNFVAHCTR
jgi:hypothetical protein